MDLAVIYKSYESKSEYFNIGTNSLLDKPRNKTSTTSITVSDWICLLHINSMYNINILSNHFQGEWAQP